MKREGKSSPGKLNQIFDNEVKCMKSFDHPNIVKLKGNSNESYAVKEDGSKISVNYIAMEFAENGELFDYVAQSGKFSEKEARFYFHQLIDTLEYMHKMGYAHRDIKPENLLLDDKFNLKVADFGFTTKSKISQSKKGTYGYMAPEILAGETYIGADGDLFASAVILFILLSQHPPFVKAEKPDRYYKRIIEGNFDKFWEFYDDDGFTDDFVDLFSKMVAYDSTDRMTLEEVKQHPWYKGPVDSHTTIMKNFSKRQRVVKNLPHDDDAPEEVKSPKKVKKTKKFTKFFDVDDGDDLINGKHS